MEHWERFLRLTPAAAQIPSHCEFFYQYKFLILFLGIQKLHLLLEFSLQKLFIAFYYGKENAQEAFKETC